MSIEYFGLNSTYSPFSNSMSLRTVTNEKFDIPRDATFLNKPVISVATGLIPTNSSFLDESFKVVVEEPNGNELIKLKKVLGKVGNEVYPTEYEVMWFNEENMQSVFWIHEKWKNQVLSITGDFIMTALSAEYLNDTIYKQIYPLGSIYLSVNDANPRDLFGGTWERWGKGRMFVGINEEDDDFSSVEKIGGEKIHILTIDEMPIHNHMCRGSITHSRPSRKGSYLTPGKEPTSNTGNNEAHNNLQPYITVYMWKRIT